jgi:hypothetical protein
LDNCRRGDQCSLPIALEPLLLSRPFIWFFENWLLKFLPTSLHLPSAGKGRRDILIYVKTNLRFPPLEKGDKGEFNSVPKS